MCCGAWLVVVVLRYVDETSVKCALLTVRIYICYMRVMYEYGLRIPGPDVIRIIIRQRQYSSYSITTCTAFGI